MSRIALEPMVLFQTWKIASCQALLGLLQTSSVMDNRSPEKKRVAKFLPRDNSAAMKDEDSSCDASPKLQTKGKRKFEDSADTEKQGSANGTSKNAAKRQAFV